MWLKIKMEMEKYNNKQCIVFLLQRKATEQFPQKVRNLAAYAGINEINSSYPKTRKIIHELIKEGYPIASNHKGYYMIRSGKQMQKYVNSLCQRMVALSERINDVYNAYRRYH